MNNLCFSAASVGNPPFHETVPGSANSPKGTVTCRNDALSTGTRCLLLLLNIFNRKTRNLKAVNNNPVGVRPSGYDYSPGGSRR